MNKKSLKKISDDLPHGAKSELAQLFDVDPAKITRVFAGQVRDKRFNARVVARALKLIEQADAAMV